LNSGTSACCLATAGDVEGHRGTDGRLYVVSRLDTGRCWYQRPLFRMGTIINIESNFGMPCIHVFVTSLFAKLDCARLMPPTPPDAPTHVYALDPGLISPRDAGVAEGTVPICTKSTKILEEASTGIYSEREEKAHIGIAHSQQKPLHLVWQFRPELLLKYDRPISSDVFTRWGAHNAYFHNQEARSAFSFLLYDAIPSLAEDLLAAAKSSKLEDMLASSPLQHLFHRRGVNMRYLLRLWAHVCARERKETQRFGYQDHIGNRPFTEVGLSLNLAICHGRQTIRERSADLLGFILS